MGRVVVELELANHRDVVLAESGQAPATQVRSLRIAGVVDTGAAHLVIPARVAADLGVPEIGEAGVRYADHRRATKKVVGDVEVRLLGRQGTFRAIVEPDREDVLIAAIVLEDMDFVVDCAAQSLRPRDPDRIVSEIE
jgi:predicted aspartyl protease